MLLIMSILSTLITALMYLGISYAQGFHSGPRETGEFVPAHVGLAVTAFLWAAWWFWGGQPMTW